MDDFEYQLRAEKEYGEYSRPTEDSKARTYVDANDGVVYEWDANRGGWFPKIDDDFLAAYQAGYGVSEPDNDTAAVTQPTSTKDTTNSAASTRKEESLIEDEKKDHATTSVGSEKDLGRKRKVSEEAGWFDVDSDHNQNVYVSGLPLDITVEEFVTLMGKCGIIMEDEKGEPKVKLYKDVNGELKGDGLCCYLKIESVDLALQLLDQCTHRDHTITVQQAKFQMKGDYNPALKKKKRNKKNRKKGGQEKLLDWRERNVEGPKRIKSERVVIFKHLFDPKEFEDNPMAINDIRDDLRQECEKFGVVKKILIFDRHPDGVGSVAFQDFASADQCVQSLHGRWFGGQQLEVDYWDGVTNYQVEETDQEREQRLSKWENFLNEGNSGEGKTTVVESGVGEGERQGVQDEEPKT